MVATRNIRTAKQPKNSDFYSIIIPCAGQGTRFKSATPKCLANIDINERIIDRQIKIFNEILPNNEIILVAGHEAESIFRNTPDNIKKVENENYAQSNIVRSIGMALRVASSDKIIICHGDVVFNMDTINTIFSSESIIFMADGMKDEEVGCSVSNNKVENLMINIPDKWAQIVYFCPKDLQMLKKIVWEKSKQKLYHFELLNELINQGVKFKGVKLNNAKAIDVDSNKDLEIAKEIRI